MMYLGNTELSPEWLSRLDKLFEFQDGEDTDALYLKLRKDTYTASEVKELITLLSDSLPDEISFESDILRLWWD